MLFIEEGMRGKSVLTLTGERHGPTKADDDILDSSRKHYSPPSFTCRCEKNPRENQSRERHQVKEMYFEGPSISLNCFYGLIDLKALSLSLLLGYGWER